MSPRRRRPVASTDPAQTHLKIVGKARAEKAARLIAEELARWGRMGEGPKLLAKATKLPLRTVYRTLHRLEEAGEVTKIGRGRFALTAVYHDVTADPTSIVGVQNIRFEVTNWQQEPTPPCRTARPWTTSDGGSAGFFGTSELTWEGRRIVLEWYPRAEKLIVKIAAVVPIPTTRAGELKGFIDAMLGLGKGETARITFIEVNVDHKLLRIEPTYFEWREVGNWSHVIYQRQAALREEFRLAHPETGDGRPLTFDRAIELLVEGSPVARMERIVKADLELARLEAQKREHDILLATERAKEKAPVRREPVTVEPCDAIRDGFG